MKNQISPAVAVVVIIIVLVLLYVAWQLMFNKKSNVEPPPLPVMGNLPAPPPGGAVGGTATPPAPAPVTPPVEGE
jgi:hypothetical protein